MNQRHKRTHRHQHHHSLQQQWKNQTSTNNANSRSSSTSAATQLEKHNLPYRCTAHDRRCTGSRFAPTGGETQLPSTPFPTWPPQTTRVCGRSPEAAGIAPLWQAFRRKGTRICARSWLETFRRDISEVNLAGSALVRTR